MIELWGQLTNVEFTFHRLTRNSPTSPVLRSHQQFSWEKIISGNPEKRAMKKAQPPMSRRPSKSENLQVSVHRARQKPMPVNEEPAMPRPPVVDNSLNNPTPAMKEIMSRMRLRAATPGPWNGKKSRSER